MSLAEFQRAFADLISTPQRSVMLRDKEGDVLAGYDITPRERQRLKVMVRHEAMSVNCSLYRVNRLIPVYSVLPHTCRLLGNRLLKELDAFWAASRHATLQYRWEARRFGDWLRQRISTGLLPGGPVEDAIQLELAIYDTQVAPRTDKTADGVASGRWKIVYLRYDPDTLLDPAIRPSALEPLPKNVAVLVDATGEQMVVCRVLP